MSRNTSCGEREDVQCLQAELRAIELWDREFWISRRHDTSEVMAMLSRRNRRTKILSELNRSKEGEARTGGQCAGEKASSPQSF